MLSDRAVRHGHLPDQTSLIGRSGLQAPPPTGRSAGAATPSVQRVWPPSAAIVVSYGTRWSRPPPLSAAVVATVVLLVVPDALPDRSQTAPPSLRVRDLSGARAVVGHLRSDRSGLLGQLVRFGLAGGLVTLVYLTVTTVLSQVVGLPFELALIIGFGCALLLHFTLQRLFVWVHSEGFALGMGHQVRRYLVMAGSQYGVTAVATAVLPSALGVPVELVYLATMVVVTSTGFLIMRFIIFHGRGAAAPLYVTAGEVDMLASRADLGVTDSSPAESPIETP